MLAAFNSLRLNLGTSDVRESVILSADVWERIEGPGVRVGPYVLGLDLGGSAAMTGRLVTGLRAACCCRLRLFRASLT